MATWEPLLEQYLDYARQRGRLRPPGATPLQFDQLQAACQRLGLVIDPSYIALLEKVNGTAYDGLYFFGVDISAADKAGRIDLVEENELIDERGDDTIYGAWQGEFFVRVASTGKYERRSVATADAYHTYPTCEALLTAVLHEEVGYLAERFAGESP